MANENVLDVVLNGEHYYISPGSRVEELLLQLKGAIEEASASGGNITGGTYDYTQLINKPSINQVVLNGDITAEDLGLATLSDIPTKVSDLENDLDYLSDAAIPTKTSDLTNDSGFITEGDIPTKYSDLEDDKGYLTAEDLESISGLSEDIAAPVETSPVEGTYRKGDQFIYNKQLYTAVTNINAGDVIVSGVGEPLDLDNPIGNLTVRLYQSQNGTINKITVDDKIYTLESENVSTTGSNPATTLFNNIPVSAGSLVTIYHTTSTSEWNVSNSDSLGADSAFHFIVPNSATGDAIFTIREGTSNHDMIEPENATSWAADVNLELGVLEDRVPHNCVLSPTLVDQIEKAAKTGGGGSAAVGDLDELTTEDKNTIVGAINEVAGKIPTKTSDLTNDSGFITENDLPEPPEVPTKTSDLTNDSGFITAEDIPEGTGGGVNDEIIANVEETDITTHAYNKGDQFIYNNHLYKAVSDIGIGSRIVIGEGEPEDLETPVGTLTVFGDTYGLNVTQITIDDKSYTSFENMPVAAGSLVTLYHTSESGPWSYVYEDSRVHYINPGKACHFIVPNNASGDSRLRVGGASSSDGHSVLDLRSPSTGWALGIELLSGEDPDHIPHNCTLSDNIIDQIAAAAQSGSSGEIPTKTSDLENDSGFITSEDLPEVPTKTSDLTNDSGFITEEDLSDDIKFNSKIIAPVETSPSQHAYDKGEQFIYENNLYRAVASISAGDELVIGEGDISDIENPIGTLSIIREAENSGYLTKVTVDDKTYYTSFENLPVASGSLVTLYTDTNRLWSYTLAGSDSVNNLGTDIAVRFIVPANASGNAVLRVGVSSQVSINFRGSTSGWVVNIPLILGEDPDKRPHNCTLANDLTTQIAAASQTGGGSSADVGNLDELETDNKTNIVGAINEVINTIPTTTSALENDSDFATYDVIPMAITEEDLAEIKEAFNPIPGMPMRMMNYSTEEQVVGTWIDGKPLYQKTLSLSLADGYEAVDGSYHYKSIDIASLNIDDVIYQTSFIKGSLNVNLPFIDTLKTGVEYRMYASHVIEKTKLVIMFMDSNPTMVNKALASTLYATIQYTKTTDPVA